MQIFRQLFLHKLLIINMVQSLAEGGELCAYCAFIVRLLCVNSACIVRE